MFWHAVWNGLAVLVHWEAWAGVLLYGVLLVLPMMIIGLLGAKDMRAGCVGMLILPVFQVFAAIVVLWSLLPIILGVGDDASWSLPWRVLAWSPGWMFRVIVMLTVVAIFSGFVPIVGRIGTFTNFVLGAFAIATAVRALASADGNLAMARVDYMPGFWTVVGFVIVGGLVTTLSTFAVAIISSLTSPSRSSDDSHASLGVVAMATFAFLGLIPAFMYGAWLGLQITSRSGG